MFSRANRIKVTKLSLCRPSLFRSSIMRTRDFLSVGVILFLVLLDGGFVASRGNRSKFFKDSLRQNSSSPESSRAKRLFSLFSIITFPVSPYYANLTLYLWLYTLEILLFFFCRMTSASLPRTPAGREPASRPRNAPPGPARPTETAPQVEANIKISYDLLILGAIK